MSKKFGWSAIIAGVSNLLLIAPALAASGRYRSGCMPDDDDCGGSELSGYIMAALIGACWVWSVLSHIKEKNYNEAFGVFLVGATMAGGWWLFAQVWPY